MTITWTGRYCRKRRARWLRWFPEVRCGYAGKRTAAIHATSLSSVGALVFWKRPADLSARQFFLLCMVTLGAYMGGYHWSRIATQPAGTPECVDTSNSVGGTVCYRARAMGANGESAYSNIVRVRR